MQVVSSNYDEQALRAVLADAPPGVFGRRSWAYWHARLGGRSGAAAAETQAVTDASDRSYPGLARLKALAAYEDGDLPSLPAETRHHLSAVDAEVDRIPIMGAYGATVSPLGGPGEIGT